MDDIKMPQHCPGCFDESATKFSPPDAQHGDNPQAWSEERHQHRRRHFKVGCQDPPIFTRATENASDLSAFPRLFPRPSPVPAQRERSGGPPSRTIITQHVIGDLTGNCLYFRLTITWAVSTTHMPESSACCTINVSRPSAILFCSCASTGTIPAGADGAWTGTRTSRLLHHYEATGRMHMHIRQSPSVCCPRCRSHSCASFRPSPRRTKLLQG
jgi:hypothetical protein